MFNSLVIIIVPVKPHSCCYVGSSVTVKSARSGCKIFSTAKDDVIKDLKKKP